MAHSSSNSNYKVVPEAADALNKFKYEVASEVGVNLNNASVSLLKYVSGISLPLANNIYEVKSTKYEKNVENITQINPIKVNIVSNELNQIISNKKD